MLKVDEDALICDFAETYQIYDMRALPLSLWATLASGLKYDSRIKTKLNGLDYDFNMILKANMCDSLNFLAWAKTEDAKTGNNKPNSVVKMLLGKEEKQNKDLVTFKTPEEFKQMWEGK